MGSILLGERAMSRPVLVIVLAALFACFFWAMWTVAAVILPNWIGWTL